MQHMFLISLLSCILLSCQGQSKSKVISRNNSVGNVGGNFENREFTYYGIPKTILSIDTSAAWLENGQKICLTGTIYKADGKTPASDVILYYYHTNTEGRYLHKPEIGRSMPPNQQGQTHGYIRGWVKTDSSGRYSIYTLRPGAYPSWDTPAHIHATIKEPNDIPEYYIDDFVFEDDTLVNDVYRNQMENRCGHGIVSLNKSQPVFYGERNIILGKNIPNYPGEK